MAGMLMLGYRKEESSETQAEAKKGAGEKVSIASAIPKGSMFLTHDAASKQTFTLLDPRSNPHRHRVDHNGVTRAGSQPYHSTFPPTTAKSTTSKFRYGSKGGSMSAMSRAIEAEAWSVNSQSGKAKLFLEKKSSSMEDRLAGH